MTDRYKIGWVRSGRDGKGLVKSRPRKARGNGYEAWTEGGGSG